MDIENTNSSIPEVVEEHKENQSDGKDSTKEDENAIADHPESKTVVQISKDNEKLEIEASESQSNSLTEQSQNKSIDINSVENNQTNNNIEINEEPSLIAKNDVINEKSLQNKSDEVEDHKKNLEKSENISIDTEMSSVNENTEKSEIENLTSEVIKPVSNSSQVFNNSLGLSLLANEYASSEDEDEDSTSSEDDSDEEDDEDDSEDEENSEDNDDNASVKSIPRNPADTLDAIAAEIEIVTNSQAYRDQVVEIDSDASSDNSSDLEIVSQSIRNQEPIQIDDESDGGNEEDNNDNKKKKGKKQSGSLRVKGELLLEDLPPIEDLHITVPETECEELGKIHSIIDQLVLVDSIPGKVLLDLDTVLFLEKGNKVLGKVFDVLGQITEPMYCIRFNSNKQIKEKNIEIGQIVYVAPKTEHTQFIILSKLMSIRGSDASWENDVEPPENHLEYSDDEEERNARRRRRHQQSDNETINGDDDTTSSISNQDDLESIQSDSTILSQRSRKRTYNNQQRRFHNYPATNNQQNFSRFEQSSNQGHNNYYQSSPYQGYNQPPQNQGYNQNTSYFNSPSMPSSYYNSGYNSWHCNFNPYNQYNSNGNYQSYQGPPGPPNPMQMQRMPPPPAPYNMPPSVGHMQEQQPLYPPNYGGRFHPPPPL